MATGTPTFLWERQMQDWNTIAMKTICLSFCLIVSGLFFCLLPFQARANIVTDGTVGPAQSLTGPDYTIAHDLGATAGHNLFP